MAVIQKHYPIIHPLRNVELNSEKYLTITEGDGIYIKDLNGKSYIDAMSGLWNVSLGYKNKVIDEAIIQQLGKVPFVNMVNHTNPTTIKFADKLIELMPERLNKLLFTCTGSESVELAIKLSRQYFYLKGYTNKNKVFALNLSYHGTYYASMSVSGIDQHLTKGYSPRVSGIEFLDTPYRPNYEDRVQHLHNKLKELELIFEKEADSMAAVIIEPILGSAGIIPLPISYIEKIKELCETHNVLLIFDEVATGFGRTGYLFDFQRIGVVPDILCLSKGINNGYIPLGATVISDKIVQQYMASQMHFEHLSTQNGNPLACAAGIATLEVLVNGDLLNSIRNKGAYLVEKLQKVLSTLDCVNEVRGQGLMVGIELRAKGNKEELLDSIRLQSIMDALKILGLLAYPFKTECTSGFSLFLPYIIKIEEIDQVIRIIEKVLKRF